MEVGEKLASQSVDALEAVGKSALELLTVQEVYILYRYLLSPSVTQPRLIIIPYSLIYI